MLVIPAQSPGIRERHGLTEQDTERSAWAIEPGGRKYGGAAAINRGLAELPGSWPWIASLYDHLAVRPLEEAGYRLVARSRHWLSYLTRTPPEVSS